MICSYRPMQESLVLGEALSAAAHYARQVGAIRLSLPDGHHKHSRPVSVRGGRERATRFSCVPFRNERLTTSSTQSIRSLCQA